SFPTFAGWVAFFLLCVIPIQIVMIVVWGGEQPAFAAKASQPLRGLIQTIVSLLVGVIATYAVIFGVGGGVEPPPPIIAHWVIVCVPVTFWAAIMWGGWPFTALIK